MAKSRRVIVKGLGGSPRTFRFNPTALALAHTRSYRRAGERALADIMATFQLKPEATGALFGVTRQAVGLWLRNGVPVERVATVERVASLAQRLRATFVRQRLPEIVRTPMPGLGGRTILETIKIAGVQPVNEMLGRAQSYVPAS